MAQETNEENENGFDPNEEVNFVVRFPNGFRKDIRSVLGSSVKQIKIILENDRIVKQEQYYLTLDNRILSEKSSLGKVGVQNGSELIVNQHKPIRVNVHYTDEDRDKDLNFYPDNLISDIAQAAARAFNVEGNNIRIIFEGEECDPDSLISDVDITDSSVVEMIVSEAVNIDIKYLSAAFKISVEKDSTIGEIKEVLKNANINDIFSKPEAVQLYFNNNQLFNNQTVEDCGMENGSVIEVKSSFYGGFD